MKIRATLLHSDPFLELLSVSGQSEINLKYNMTVLLYRMKLIEKRVEKNGGKLGEMEIFDKFGEVLCASEITGQNNSIKLYIV